ncbi:DUF2752 domain-containing protein [Bacteroidales bacterium OttesenSCG-928-M11]|nr:DUF2752 domain-containing protein [Bacteroidales bacterium OttesenSCG-928-M11]
MTWISFTDWLREHLLTCPSKHFLHVDCPGCGLQRSFLALLEGNLKESLVLYPATIPMLVLFLYAGLHIKFDFQHGASIIKWGYIACTLIIIVFYFYKVFTLKIF